MISMSAGDTKILRVTVRDDARQPVDLFGASIRWHLSAEVDVRPALIEKSIGSGIAVVDQQNGLFEVSIDPVDTEDLVGIYYHEAEVILENGAVATVFRERITILRTLIKPPE